MKASRPIFVSAAVLAAVLAWPGHAAKKGGSGGPPSKLPIIATFAGSVATVGDPYADSNLEGGWSNMPGTGNYTLQLDAGGGSRVIELDFSHQILPSPSGGTFGYAGSLVQIPLFLSINRICADGYLEPGTCNDGGLTDGSLKAMTLGGPNLLVNLRARFADPLVNKAELLVHCGPNNPLNQSPLDPYDVGTDPIRATCTKDRNDGACMEWSLSPSTGGGSLACRVIRQESQRGSSTFTDLGLYDLPFTLILERDENGNGIADCSDDPFACAP